MRTKEEICSAIKRCEEEMCEWDDWDERTNELQSEIRDLEEELKEYCEATGEDFNSILEATRD